MRASYLLLVPLLAACQVAELSTPTRSGLTAAATYDVNLSSNGYQGVHPFNVVIHAPAPPPNAIAVSLDQLVPPGTFSSTEDRFAKAVQAIIAAQGTSQPIKQLNLAATTYQFDPGGGSAAFIQLTGLSNLVIEGNGATLLFNDHRGGIKIDASFNLVLKDLVIDYGPDIELSFPGHLSSDVTCGNLLRIGKGDHGHPFNPATLVNSIVTFDVANRAWPTGPRVEQYYRPPAALTPAAGCPGSFQAPASFSGQTGSVLLRPAYAGHAIEMTSYATHDITFDTVAVRRAPEFAFLGDKMGSGIHLINCRVERDPSSSTQLISTNADAAHFASNDGNILIENSDFGYQGDDGLNINTELILIQASGSGLTFTQSGSTQDRFAANDLIEVIDPSTMQVKARAMVNTVTLVTGTTYSYLVRATPLGGDTLPTSGAFVMASLSHASSNYIVRNNQFHDNRARGSLLQTFNGLYDGNTISRTTSGGLLLLSSVGTFDEGAGAQNVLVRRNQFTATNRELDASSAGTQVEAALQMFSHVNWPAQNSPPTHPANSPNGQLEVSGNTFDAIPAVALLISSATDVTVVRNVIHSANTLGPSSTTCALGQSPSAMSGSIMLDQVAHVTLAGNSRTLPGPTEAICIGPGATSITNNNSSY